MMSFNSKPKLSVLVAAFNQEKYIGRCLRSLLNQTLSHSEYEIIIVDDGSTDRTSYALELFKDPNDSVIKILTNNKNLGLPISLNKAIRTSKAKYIVRVDSDDFVNTNFLNFLIEYLETNENVDAVGCDYLLINDVEEVIERRSCIDNPIACGILFRKEHIINIGLYDEKFLYHEDKDFRIRFEKKYKIGHLNIPLYRYRRHDANITNNTKKMRIYHENLIKKHGKQALEY